MFLLLMVLLFVGVGAVIACVVATSIYLVVRSAGRAAQPAQPSGRPGNLDWLPEQDDLERRTPYGVRTDGSPADSGHHGHHSHQDHHQHHSPSPNFDSSPSPSQHDSGGHHH